MIAKVTRGRRVGGLIRYLFGPGRHNEHESPRIIAAWEDPRLIEPATTRAGERDYRELVRLLEEPVAAQVERPARPVWHCSFRAAPEDRDLSDEEWATIARDALHRTGLAPDSDDLACRWIVVRHGDDHVHVVATLARQDGGRAKPENDFYRVGEAARAAEERFDLTRTAPRDRTGPKRPSRGETEKAERTGKAEPARVTLRREARAAAAGASGPDDFFDRLRAAGVMVRVRESDLNPGQVTGYSLAWPDANGVTAAGEPVWFSGSKLGNDLSWTKVAERWPDDPMVTGNGPIEVDDLDIEASSLTGTVRDLASYRGEEPPPNLAPSLRHAVEMAAGRAASLPELVYELRRRGVLVVERQDEAGDGTEGYAVAWPHVQWTSGQPIYMAGHDLAPELSWPRLRDRFEHTGTQAERQDAMQRPSNYRGDERPDDLAESLRQAVVSAADEATTEGEFRAALEARGLLVGERAGDGREGTVGYAVAWPHVQWASGRPIYIAGHELGADLSWPRLQARWARGGRTEDARATAHEPTSSTQSQPVTDEERRRIWDEARRIAERSAEEIRRLAAVNPTAASDVAGAAGDVLASLGRSLEGLEGGPLSRLAEGYQRATLEPYGRHTAPTRTGHDLRETARLVALLGRARRSETGNALAVAAGLALLLDAVKDLRASQERLAQAQAARAAADELRVHTERYTPAPARTSAATAVHARRAEPPRPGRGR